MTDPSICAHPDCNNATPSGEDFCCSGCEAPGAASMAARLQALQRFAVVIGYPNGVGAAPEIAVAVLLDDALAVVEPPTLRGAARMSRPRARPRP